MTKDEAIEYFQRKYPGKNIVLLPESNPTEIICEIDPAPAHPEYSVVLAAIKKSVPHYHTQLVEKYTVQKGELLLTVNDKNVHLQEGDSYVIQPSSVHHAEGEFTLVMVESHPGWFPDDHILA